MKCLGIGDKVALRVQGSEEINVVIIEHGNHPSILRITTQTKDGQKIDSTTVELEIFDDRYIK